MYYFYLFLVLPIFGHYHLDDLFFEKIQDYEDNTLSSSKWEVRQVTLDYFVPICFFL
jgi:hypothetical protein